VVTLPPGVIDPTWDAGIFRTPTNLGDEDEPAGWNKTFLPLIVR
jgi:hypothetical protein